MSFFFRFYEAYHYFIVSFLLMMSLGGYADLWPLFAEAKTLRAEREVLRMELQQKEAALQQAGPLAEHLEKLQRAEHQAPFVDRLIQMASHNGCQFNSLKTEIKNAATSTTKVQAAAVLSKRLLLQLQLSCNFSQFYHFLEMLIQNGFPQIFDFFSLKSQGDLLLVDLHLLAFPWALGMQDDRTSQVPTPLPSCCARDPFQVAVQAQQPLKMPLSLQIKEKEEELRLQEALEAAEPRLLRLWQIYYAKAQDLVPWLQSAKASLLSKQGQVHVDARLNILGVRDTAERLRNIAKLIKKLDQPVKQVLIEARLASVDSDYEQELGLRFAVLEKGASSDVVMNQGLHALPSQFSLVVAHLADNSLLDIKLAALENEGHGELISSPRLFTANQETASIEAGEEISYQEATSSGATSVIFKKAVLSLKVTPELLPGKKVLLHLQINQDRPNARLVLGVPTISTRQIITSVLVLHGQTVVLGGIYEVNNEETREGLPLLDKIPLFGRLFQVKIARANKRELLVFVTPRVIEW